MDDFNFVLVRNLRRFPSFPKNVLCIKKDIWQKMKPSYVLHYIKLTKSLAAFFN